MDIDACLGVEMGVAFALTVWTMLVIIMTTTCVLGCQTKGHCLPPATVTI